MLDLVFGLNGRLGRLQYFLATIILAVVMTVIVFGLVVTLFNHTSIAAVQPYELASWPVICAAAFFLIASFSLQSMRIRDIGWDPVCIIPAWIAVLIIDSVVAGRIPGWAVGGQHHETIVGASLNLIAVLVLTFWPGDGTADENPQYRSAPKAKSSSGVSAARLASVTRSATWQQ
jgi:uncharacterized membrane protein YhaH (DUF805 family)